MIYDKAMHEARKYWRDRLPAMSFAGHIALDHPRPNGGQRSPQPGSVERAFDAEVHALLRRLSGNNPFLAYATLLSALKICCYRISGDRAVTIFSPATSEAAAANLLAIDGAVDADGTFKDALLATKEVLSGAYKHQQYPFSHVQLDLPEDRRPDCLPMVATMAGLHGGSPGTPADVVVSFESTEAGTKASFHYDARIYDEPTIRNTFELFHAILKQGLANPAAWIADLRTEEAGDGHSAPEAGDVRVHSLVEAHAAQHPERVAVVEGGRTTTYAALDADAARLAGTLRGLELDPRKPVVILLDAGTEMIVSMLAVLKAGLSFAPVRLLSAGGAPIADLLETLAGECIICGPEHVADLQQVTADRPIVQHVVTARYSDAALDIAAHRIAAAPPPGSGETRDASFTAACVLLDGRAKSFVTHADLVRLFQWLAARCGIGADDRCLLSPAVSAGEQLCDTLGMLTAGGSVEIADLKETSVLAERLLSPSITVWDLPTALAQNLLRELLVLRAERPHLAGPRNIFLTGEKQCARLANELARSFPDARLTGFYSPPAIGIRTTFFALEEQPIAAQAIPGFGHGVLHETGEPVPMHTGGELHICGMQTGLRAEAREGGRLAWLRGDEHRFVKYGCTIELTKIEAVLCAHEDIRAAEVIAVKTELRADALIVAFLLAGSAQLVPEAAADYLVLEGNVDLIPDRFIVGDEFPLTPEGSIDRALLIARHVSSRERDRQSAAADVIQKQLKGIWLDVLQADDVGDDDSFFTRGGNSLKATLLIARIRDEFGVDLSVQKFFRDPGIRAVAQLIAAESANASGPAEGPDLKMVPRERYRVQLPELES